MIAILGCDVQANRCLGPLDVTMITGVLATHPSYKLSRVETKMDHG
jgi:hypothetical protein